MAIVETIKEFRTILLGQKIKVYIDNKNLTFSNFTTERVMRWRMVLEEYNPELVYIKGPDNIVADALSRLDLLPDEKDSTQELNLFEWLHLELEEWPEDSFSLHWALIQREQKKDSQLLDAIKKLKDYKVNVIDGQHTRKQSIIHYKEKVVVPQSLHKCIVQWYHEYLMHPGVNITESTIW